MQLRRHRRSAIEAKTIATMVTALQFLVTNDTIMSAHAVSTKPPDIQKNAIHVEQFSLTDAVAYPHEGTITGMVYMIRRNIKETRVKMSATMEQPFFFFGLKAAGCCAVIGYGA